MTGDAEFGEQRLHRRDVAGLIVDVDVGEHEGGVDGERTEHLGGGAVVEVVKAAAQRLAIEGDAALSALATRGLEQGGVAAKCTFDRLRIEALLWAGARRQFIPKNALRLRRCTSMQVTIPRIRVQPVTMARMENSSTYCSV
jgi:hypothetical protein